MSQTRTATLDTPLISRRTDGGINAARAGFYLHLQVECLEHGAWSRFEAACYHKTCGRPRLSAGAVLLAHTYLYGSRVPYTCASGAYLWRRGCVNQQPKVPHSFKISFSFQGQFRGIRRSFASRTEPGRTQHCVDEEEEIKSRNSIF